MGYGDKITEKNTGSGLKKIILWGFQEFGVPGLGRDGFCGLAGCPARLQPAVPAGPSRAPSPQRQRPGDGAANEAAGFFHHGA